MLVFEENVHRNRKESMTSQKISSPLHADVIDLTSEVSYFNKYDNYSTKKSKYNINNRSQYTDKIIQLIQKYENTQVAIIQ